MIGVSCFVQELQGLTGCLDDIVSSASGRATPGLLSQLAKTRREILPSSMHTPWAGSNRYKISELMSFIAERPLSVDSPSLPFWVRFKIRLRPMPYTHPATLDTGRAANAYPRGISPRLSSNHFQSARAFFCYPQLWTRNLRYRVRMTACPKIMYIETSRCPQHFRDFFGIVIRTLCETKCAERFPFSQWFSSAHIFARA